MVLFPIAFVFLIAVLVWVARNEMKPEEGRLRTWTRLRPRPPRNPHRGRPNGPGGRRGSRTPGRATREPH